MLIEEMKEEKVKYKLIENYLKNYKHYKTAIGILQEQLEYLIPGFQVNYQCDDDGVQFKLNKQSDSQESIDRLSSLKALVIYEELIQKKMTLDSIEKSLEQLNQTEYDFIHLRYFQEKSAVATSIELGYSEKYIFQLRKKILEKLLIPLSGLLIM
ncbi:MULTISPECIES: hypothetical protein [Clostridia]|uniref:hypothetical protein n=1 Tax=Clostridia TaxID=186801 RepID=UPI000EA00B0A|nr:MULTISPECIES: hypothetical protein [Clostridia]NBJ71590.1 hypothetical protein [Roseburia sp. 1XD42-34]RKI74092.1 hypothetical protein D7V87_19450 [Clostridium sp. 1xD42-85]